MDFLDRAHDEAFYMLVNNLRDRGHQNYMLIRANIETQLRDLVAKRTSGDAKAIQIFSQKVELQLHLIDLAFRSIVPVFQKKNKLKDVLAELQKKMPTLDPNLARQVEHWWDIYQLVVQGKAFPPAGG